MDPHDVEVSATPAEPPRKPGLGAGLMIYLAIVTFFNGWTATRVVLELKDSADHGVLQWHYRTTPFLTFAGGLAGVSLIGLALIWMRRKIGIYLFVAAQVAGVGLLVFYGAVGPQLLISVLSTAVLVALTSERREFFR